MAKTCIKCGYTRRETDSAPDYACPNCGVVYAKAEAAHAQALEAKARTDAIVAKMREAAPAAAAPTARADAMIQQMMLAQGSEQRKASPYRGMALVALVAFSVGFASAAGLYSGMAKLNKPAAANCPRQS